MFLAAVAGDGGRVDSPSGQLLVEQHPRPGAALPVDVPQPGSGEVVDPGQSERVARRDDQALLAVHEPDDGDLVLGREQPVQVRQRVLAGHRVEQVGAGDVTQPVPQSDQPAERADVRRRQRDQRVDRAEPGRGEIEHEVVRADGDDGPVDLGRSSQQLDADPLARVVSFGAGRDHEQTVGTDERGQHAGSPGQWGGDDLALDPTESDPDPVVHTENGRQLAGEPGGGQRSLPWGGAFELGQQGGGEDVEGEGGGDREAGRAEDRRGPDGSQHDGVPGPDGDAVHGEGPGGGDHPGACSRPGRHWTRR